MGETRRLYRWRFSWVAELKRSVHVLRLLRVVEHITVVTIIACCCTYCTVYSSSHNTVACGYADPSTRLITDFICSADLSTGPITDYCINYYDWYEREAPASIYVRMVR